MLQEIIDFLVQPWYLYFRDAFESDTAGVVFVAVLLALGLAGLWLWWDSFDFFDMVGAIALLTAFLLISPLILVAYLGAKALAWAATWVTTRSSLADERWFRRYRHVMRHRRLDTRALTKKDYEAIAAIRIDTEITEAEKDRNVEEYLQSGQRDEAIAYVKDMIHVARSMGDKKAIARYEKYYLSLRLGRPVSGHRPKFT
jgi:hypothetical protein